jgi:hypothetical protein
MKLTAPKALQLALVFTLSSSAHATTSGNNQKIDVTCNYNKTPPSGASKSTLKNNISSALKDYVLPLYDSGGEKYNSQGSSETVTIENVTFNDSFDTKDTSNIKLSYSGLGLKLDSDYYSNSFTNTFTSGQTSFLFKLKLQSTKYKMKDIYDVQDTDIQYTDTSSDESNWTSYQFETIQNVAPNAASALSVLFAHQEQDKNSNDSSNTEKNDNYGFTYYSIVNGEAKVAGLCISQGK